MNDYVKVVVFCLEALTEEEVEIIWNEWKVMYFQYRREKEKERETRCLTSFPDVVGY